MIVRPSALGTWLRRMPVAPTSVAAHLGNRHAALAFRQIVRELFPEAAEEILAAPADGGNREHARVWAFLRHVEHDCFPVYEVDEYEQLLCGIPFVRHGWSYDRFHDLDLPSGELLLFTLCAQPYESGFDTRVSLLDAASTLVPRDLLAEIPDGGFTPAELHARLDGTPYAAGADFADWLWGETGSVFLDIDDEVDVHDADWTAENVALLTDQWERARAVLDQIGALGRRLEESPPANFGRLLDAALGRDPHQEYLRLRRLHVCEITEAGIVPIPRDEPGPGDDALTVPVGAAG